MNRAVLRIAQGICYLLESTVPSSAESHALVHACDRMPEFLQQQAQLAGSMANTLDCVAGARFCS
jgi:hypothetical protein